MAIKINSARVAGEWKFENQLLFAPRADTRGIDLMLMPAYDYDKKWGDIVEAEQANIERAYQKYIASPQFQAVTNRRQWGRSKLADSIEKEFGLRSGELKSRWKRGKPYVKTPVLPEPKKSQIGSSSSLLNFFANLHETNK